MPDIAPPALSRIKYIIHHRSDNTPPRYQCVHFITYGLHYGPPDILFPILSLDLSKHEPPPDPLCARLTGLDDELQHSFLSFPANKAEFHTAWATLWRKMKREPQGSCVVVKINCMAGMHRSVAMAERLAEQVRLRDGFRAECLHLDLAKGADVRDGVKVRRVREISPTRRRGSERGEGRAREEARVSESEIRVWRVREASPTRGLAGERDEDVPRRGPVRERGEGRAREEARLGESEIRVKRFREAPPITGRASERDEGKAREKARVDETEIRVRRVRETSPTRGRKSERGEGRTRGEARVSENGPRAAVPPTRDIKTVSWVTSVPVREPHRRQREIGDRAAGSARRNEERRCLSS